MDISTQDPLNPLDRYGIDGELLDSEKHIEALQKVYKRLDSIQNMLPVLKNKCEGDNLSLLCNSLENYCEIVKYRIDQAHILTNLLQLLEEPFDIKGNRYLLLSENKYTILKNEYEAYEKLYKDESESQMLITLKTHNSIRVVDHLENTDVMAIIYDKNFYSQYYSVITLAEIKHMIHEIDNYIYYTIDASILPPLRNAEHKFIVLNQIADAEPQMAVAEPYIVLSEEDFQKFVHSNAVRKIYDIVFNKFNKSISILVNSHGYLKELREDAQTVITTQQTTTEITSKEDAQTVIITQQTTTEITSKADTESTIKTTEATEEQSITPTTP